MRIVHLSTYDSDGGAARAAFRIHESLLAAGQESWILVRTKHSHSERVVEIPSADSSEALLAELVQRYYIDASRTNLSNTHFSLGWPGNDLSTHPLVQQADVIHLHWVSGLISSSSLAALRRMGKPMVWTLHDQRAYTGGCHYSAGCRGFETECRDCAQLASDPRRLPAANLADQAEVVDAGNLTVIAPSRWMAQCARRSRVFKGSRIEVIPYGIDTTRFLAVQQAEARRQLVLPSDGFLMLVGVDNAAEKRKGLKQLFRMLDDCGKSERFRAVDALQKASLLCFGELDTNGALPWPVRSFGRVRSDELLTLIYSAADLFLLPSLEDNLPNTVIESMSCGTPVVAFNAGGVSDMVLEGETGFLASTGDFAAFGEIILRSMKDVLALRAMRDRCRCRVEAGFSYARQAENHVRLYAELLDSAKKVNSTVLVASGRESVPEGNRHFRPVLPHVLKDLFDAEPDALTQGKFSNRAFMTGRISASTNRHIKRILKRAVNRSWCYDRLRSALNRELPTLNAKQSWRKRANRFIRRVLGVW